MHRRFLVFLALLISLNGCSAGLKSEAMGAGGSPAEQAGPADLSGYLEAEALDMTPASPEKKEGKKSPTKVRTWKRATALPNSARLMIGDKEELPLGAVQAAVQVDGFRARVLLDYSYFNDREGEYEGTFKLRLPQGATPYFLAFGPAVLIGDDGAIPEAALIEAETARRGGFDENSILEARAERWQGPKVARIVPKQKAQFAYKSTVRRRVDPALMEWAGAGVFQARVFPLQGKKTYRIVVGYDLDLTRAGEDWELAFGLPARANVKILDLMIQELDGIAATVTPEVEAAKVDGRRCYRFEGDATESVRVRLPGPGPLLLLGKDSKVGPHFAAAVLPEIPADENAAASPEALFLLDTSLSANPEQFNVMLALMRALLDNNREALKRFNVLFFNIEARWYRQAWVENSAGEVEAFMKTASELVLEGATDLSLALKQARKPVWLKGEARGDIFLLSDGAATWGEGSVPALAALLEGRGRLFAYNTGLRGLDRRALDSLTRESGGALFSVVGEAEIPKASRAHRKRPWRLVDWSIEGGSDLLIAGRPKVLFPGQPLLVCGRGTPRGPLRLSLERDGQRKEIKIEGLRRVESELTRRIYGAVAVAQIEELGAATERLARAYAIHYRVPAATCSLLMLESEEDYQRFEIRPEDEATRVRERPADAALAAVRKELAGQLADPKAAFLSFLAELERNPGVAFELGEEVRAALAAMPSSAFQIDAEALDCRLRRRADLKPELLKALAERKIDYDAVTKDAADRRERGGPADALKALSSLVENSPGDLVLLRDVAYSAVELELFGHAYHLLKRVMAARPDEPQTYLAAARCLSAMGRGDLALAHYEVALQGRWDTRFGEFRTIAVLDYQRLLRAIEAGKTRSSVSADYVRGRLKALTNEVKLEQGALVISMTWNTDNTDIDLHIWEPDAGFFESGGDHCYYENPRTAIGGRMTRDVTQGYGPEMYSLSKPRSGSYRIAAKYYASDANRASARTKVTATIYQGWGTEKEKVFRKVVTLERGKDMHDLLKLELP